MKTMPKKEINEEIYNQDIVSLRGLDKVVPISMSAQDMQLMEHMNMGLTTWPDSAPRAPADARHQLTLHHLHQRHAGSTLQRTVQPGHHRRWNRN